MRFTEDAAAVRRRTAWRRRLGLVAACVVLAPLGGHVAYGQATEQPVTINLQNAPVQTVLRSLFKSAGKNFTIDPSVNGYVTLDVNGVPFDTALNAVLAGTNPPLQAPLVNGIYEVGVHKAQAASASMGPPSPPPGQANTPSTATDPHHAYRIPISHYDAAYMSYLIAAFSQKGGAPIIVPSDPSSQSQNGSGQQGYGMQGNRGGMGQGGYGQGGLGTSGFGQSGLGQTGFGGFGQGGTGGIGGFGGL